MSRLQVENEAELAEVLCPVEGADRPVLEGSATTCCYAQSEKSWGSPIRWPLVVESF